MKYTENKNRQVINVDFDHTLTDDIPGEYTEDPPAKVEMVTAIRTRYMAGNIIIIWSARWWDNAPFLVSWLIKHGVPFHGVMMGKGGSDCYVDDKAMPIKEFLR